MIKEAALPDGEARAAQARAAADALIKAGYVAVGLDHFARPDDSLGESSERRKPTPQFPRLYNGRG